jgi:hypothetical protein
MTFEIEIYKLPLLVMGYIDIAMGPDQVGEAARIVLSPLLKPFLK